MKMNVKDIYRLIRNLQPTKVPDFTQIMREKNIILEQLMESHYNTIYRNNRFFSKNGLEGKPDGLYSNGIVQTRAIQKTKHENLLTIPYSQYITAQAMMHVVGRNETTYAQQQKTKRISQSFSKNNTFVKFLMKEINRALAKKKPVKPNHKPLYSMFPLLEDDNLTYYLQENKTEKEHTFTEEWLVGRYFKTQYTIFDQIQHLSYTTIPTSFTYEPALEQLTLESLQEQDIVLFPHIADETYFHQPFMLANAEVLEKVYEADWQTEGFIMVFPSYSLPSDSKAGNKKYQFQAKFVYDWMDKNNIQHSDMYVWLDHDNNYHLSILSEDITSNKVPELPATITRQTILEHNLFPYPGKDRGYKRKHQEIAEQFNDVTLLTNVGPKKRLKLHEQQIYTLRDLYRANLELPTLSKRFLEVNFQNKVPILPLCLPKDRLQRSDNECFVDMEFAYDKSLDYTCIYNLGVLHVKNGTSKFHQFTVEALNEDGEYDLLDKFFTFIQKENPVMYHWNHTERTMLKSAITRHDQPKWHMPKSIDFYKVMRDNYITVKHAYNLKLKTIAKAMKQNKLIQHYHDDIVHGTDLSTTIVHMYETESYSKDSTFVKRVEAYNKDDIYTMYEIIEAIRKYYNA